jgi:hypothetical protein
MQQQRPRTQVIRWGTMAFSSLSRPESLAKTVGDLKGNLRSPAEGTTVFTGNADAGGGSHLESGSPG